MLCSCMSKHVIRASMLTDAQLTDIAEHELCNHVKPLQHILPCAQKVVGVSCQQCAVGIIKQSTML